MNEMSYVKMRSPWVLHQRKLCEMFRRDMGVDVDFDEKAKKYTLRVATAKKADALSRLIAPEVSFGHVECKVCIVPANSAGDILPSDAPMIDVLNAAFDGNDCVCEIRPVSRGLFRDLCYVVFENRVVQYEADNLADINGNISTLYEDIARDIFTEANGALFCTSVSLGNGLGDSEGAKLDKPLGEWP